VNGLLYHLNNLITLTQTEIHRKTLKIFTGNLSLVIDDQVLQKANQRATKQGISLNFYGDF
jgi:predicted HicB family RNase H-like nuclease